MKNPLLFLICTLISPAFWSCDSQTTPEALGIQNPYTYDEQYYTNLRAYKQSDHAIAYGWFAEYWQSYSLALRFDGLPDSLDICSLWGGIPSTIENDTLGTYNPTVSADMQRIRQTKGIRMVAPFIVRMDKTGSRFKGWYTLDNQGIENFADFLLRHVFEYDIDGLDLDYEPEGDFLSGENFTYFVKYLGKTIGPNSANPDKLLIIDFFGTYPSSETEPYVNYYVSQSYSTSHASTLQNLYDLLSWCPTKKFVVAENIGDNWKNGGVAFTEADGNTLSADKTRLYSLEGMARWNPTQGRKGGFGAFYMHRDYNSDPPYKNMRKAIQAANPAIH